MSKEQEWKEQLERSARKSRRRRVFGEGIGAAGDYASMIVLAAVPRLWLVA